MPLSKISAPSARPRGPENYFSSEPLLGKKVTNRILQILGGETLELSWNREQIYLHLMLS